MFGHLNQRQGQGEGDNAGEGDDPMSLCNAENRSGRTAHATHASRLCCRSMAGVVHGALALTALFAQKGHPAKSDEGELCILELVKNPAGGVWGDGRRSSPEFTNGEDDQHVSLMAHAALKTGD